VRGTATEKRERIGIYEMLNLNPQDCTVLQLCDLWHWFGGLAASSGLLTWPPLTPIFITCSFKFLLLSLSESNPGDSACMHVCGFPEAK
jgi:hypothetical protein